ncbi:ribonuclease H-like domain-containing protein [Tanacetum coccineum]
MDTLDSLLSSSTSKVENINGRILGKDGKPFKSYRILLRDNTSKETVKIVELSNDENVEGSDVAILLPVADECPKQAKDVNPTQILDDGFIEVNNETWKASNDIGSIMDASDSEEVENVFVEDNGKAMNHLVDDAWKKVEAPPKKTPRKTSIWSGENVVEISSDKVEGSGEWDSPEYQDTANSGGKKETKAMVFHKLDTEEVSDRFVASCFVNGLEAYDGEINLGVEENMISNEYAVKLCLEHEVKRGNKIVKKELIVALRGEIYFVKFIINPKEDDVEPGVIFRRSFLRMTKTITDLGAGMSHPIIYHCWVKKNFCCLYAKWGKVKLNKKRAMENLNLFYQDIGTSSSTGRHLTQEEAAKEALAIRISQKFTLLEEVKPVLKTMAYHDKYKKVIDEIWKDKLELDGMIMKEEEEAIKKVKGEALKEKDDPRAFIFPIRLEGQVKKNALADTGSDINTMPYQIYEQLEREEMKNVDRGITMINHTQAEAMGLLTNVLFQVGVTTLIAKFLILDIPIDRDAPIIVGQGFLCTIGGIVNTLERLFSTFDGFCHETFCAARSDVLRTAENDSNDEEEYEIKRNKFGAPIYGLKPTPYLNCNDPAERLLALQAVINPFWKISVWKKAVSFVGSLPAPLKHVNWKLDYKGCYTNEEEAKGQ